MIHKHTPLSLSGMRRNEDSGVALLEFAVMLPVLMILVAGLINVGYLMWTIQVHTDAVRYGARWAGTRSNVNNDCSTLIDEGEQKAKDYIDDNNANRFGWWNDPPEFRVCKDSYDGDVECFFEGVVETITATNCLFCYENILTYVDMHIRARFPSESWCDTCATAPAC